MASQWGNNSLAPGASAGWFFARPNLTGSLPVLQVMPLTPSFTDNLWNVSSDGYPYLNELGVSTTWSQLSDDLSNLIYYMVVENKSNSVVEYAFLEADFFGPSNVPAPSGGLVGNVNYFLEDGGKPLTGVTATVNFTVDFDSSSNGYSFQLNGYSTEGTGITTEWQQFVIYASPSSTQLWARIDTWSGTALTDELNRIDVALAKMPSATIKAGYAFKMQLTYTNDGTGTVTGAIYTVTDETGKTLGTTTIGIVGQTLRTTGKPATSANLAPLAALQYNIGGDFGGNFATLSSGAGTIVYTATNFLSVVNAEPSYTDFDDGTAENANLTFGPLANTANQVVTQSFVVTSSAGTEPQERLTARRGHVLPPPDNLSLGRHVLPPPPNQK
jgi:hypothetical protein